MRTTPYFGDPRLEDAIQLLAGQRKPNGRWPVEKRIPGTTYFNMKNPAVTAAGTRSAPYGGSNPARRPAPAD